MKTFRKIIFWLHLFTGSIAGLIIFTMCVTGSLLAFEKQILRYAEREMRFVDPQEGIKRLPISELFRKVREKKPGMKPDGFSIQSNPSSSVSLSIGREAVLFLDPFTGEVLGEGSGPTRKFFRIVTNVHRWLGMSDKNRETGRSITGICNAAFLVLAMSGLYLWLPSKWSRQQVRAITWFQAKLKGRQRDFNWHNVIGFWCAPVLIVLTLSGITISFQWASNLLYSLTGSEKPSAAINAPRIKSKITGAHQTQIPPNIDHLLFRAQRQVTGWQTITVRFSTITSTSITFLMEAGESINPFARSELTLNPETGEIKKWQPYRASNTGRKLRIWARGLHTGEALRLPGQILAFVATTGGGFLVFTGLLLALRRFRNWRLRKAKNTSKLQKLKPMPSHPKTWRSHVPTNE